MSMTSLPRPAVQNGLFGAALMATPISQDRRHNGGYASGCQPGFALSALQETADVKRPIRIFMHQRSRGDCPLLPRVVRNCCLPSAVL